MAPFALACSGRGLGKSTQGRKQPLTLRRRCWSINNVRRDFYMIVMIIFHLEWVWAKCRVIMNAFMFGAHLSSCRNNGCVNSISMDRLLELLC